MQIEAFDMGRGDVYLLEQPDDVAELPTPLRPLIPAAMQACFRSFPASIEALAAECGRPWLASWLRGLAAGTPRLRVYDTAHGADGFGQAALLEIRTTGRHYAPLLDFRSATAPSEQFACMPPPRDPISGVPAALMAVHDAIGGITFQLGGSGTLLPPDRMTRLIETMPHLATDWEIPADRARRLVPIYESSGDYLCFVEGADEAQWYGYEAGGTSKVHSVESALELLFEHLRDDTWITYGGIF